MEIKELGQPQPGWAPLLGLLRVYWDAEQHFPGWEPFKELSGSEKQERELGSVWCFSAASGHSRCEFSVLINSVLFCLQLLGGGSGSSGICLKGVSLLLLALGSLGEQGIHPAELLPPPPFPPLLP